MLDAIMHVVDAEMLGCLCYSGIPAFCVLRLARIVSCRVVLRLVVRADRVVSYHRTVLGEIALAAEVQVRCRVLGTVRVWYDGHLVRTLFLLAPFSSLSLLLLSSSVSAVSADLECMLNGRFLLSITCTLNPICFTQDSQNDEQMRKKTRASN